MRVNVHQAFKEWASETVQPFNAEDAYCAGFEIAMRARDEERRLEESSVVKNLRAISALRPLFG